MISIPKANYYYYILALFYKHSLGRYVMMCGRTFLEGENIGEFGKLRFICKSFIC